MLDERGNRVFIENDNRLGCSVGIDKAVKRNAWGVGTKGIGCCLLAMAAWPGMAAGAEDWQALYLDAKPVLDVRYRYEYVDQDTLPRNAKAHTVRTRAGFETGRVYGIGVGFDVEWVQSVGPEKYNDTINGKTQYPVVADPEDEQVNQLFIVAKDTIPDTEFKLGRQRIIWDNHRFIGNVGFRQNEQTFDAFRGQVTAIADTVLEYTYLNEVQRIFGTDSDVGELGLDGHGLRAQYTGIEGVKITPFALWLDYDDASQAGLDSATYGFLVQGGFPIDQDWSVLFEVGGAYQQDHADNPNDFDLLYSLVQPGVAYKGIRVHAGYEVLEGDGTSAFQTPLATLHKFNGLTDQFLTTPPDGLQDLYLMLDAPLPGLSGLSLKANYHQFWAENGDAHYGSEWAAGLFKTVGTNYGGITFGLEYAAYDADGFSQDTDKLWATVQFKMSPKPLRAYLGADGG